MRGSIPRRIAAGRLVARAEGAKLPWLPGGFGVFDRSAISDPRPMQRRDFVTDTLTAERKPGPSNYFQRRLTDVQPDMCAAAIV